MAQAKTKGPQMEEVLRNYFLDLGYFAVRGVKFNYQGVDVTDVDLWLYMRPSPLTRDRINVDAKQRRTPQAIERIFWTRGLQLALGLEGCIVATTDRRPTVREFGRLNGVNVLDGTFFERLMSAKYREHPHRLTEEQFLAAVSNDTVERFTGDWRRKVEEAKSRLLTQLDYSGCNAWLRDSGYFMEQAVLDPRRREAACRITYLTLSFFLLGVDFIFKGLSFVEPEERASALREGFTHGTLGKIGTDKMLSTAMALIEHYLLDGHRLSSLLQENLTQAFAQVPADILKEYFAQSDVSRTLFLNARKLESLAYARVFAKPTELEPDLQAILGVALDFLEIERRRFFESFRS